MKLARQLLVRRVVLRDHHDARRALVEPVHDAGPHLAADAAEVLDVMEQRVDQRAGRIARGRVHHHAGRLVDDDDVGVLEEDLERQILGLRRRGRGSGSSTAITSPSRMSELGLAFL